MFITPSRLQLIWQDFSPAVYSGMSGTPSFVARTVQYARWARHADTVWAVASVTVNATTSGGAGIQLPVPAAFRNFCAGTLALMGTGTLPPDQSGVAYMAPDLTRLVLVAYTNGFRDVGAAGQTLRYSVCYEAAV